MRAILTLSLVTLSAVMTWAQDFHYSQFFTNQMVLNPALTGLYQNDFGVSGIYRTQWNAIDAQYENYAFCGDAKLNVGPGKLGIGGIMLRDVLPSAKYSATTAMLSGAYHFFLDYPEKHLLSVGVQLGWTAKTFSPGNDLYFGNQYSNYQLDLNLANNEALQSQTINSFNINAGANYKLKIDYRTRLSLGGNLNSISTPNESFASDKNANQLGIRYLGYAMLDFELNNKIILSPKVFYANQSRGQDLNLGLLATYKFKNCTYAQIGAFNRLKDAGIGMLGFGWQSYLLRASVDFTTSSLRDVSKIADAGYKAPRAYEIAFVYTGIFKKHDTPNLTVPCGIF